MLVSTVRRVFPSASRDHRLFPVRVHACSSWNAAHPPRLFTSRTFVLPLRPSAAAFRARCPSLQVDSPRLAPGPPLRHRRWPRPGRVVPAATGRRACSPSSMRSTMPSTTPTAPPPAAKSLPDSRQCPTTTAPLRPPCSPCRRHGSGEGRRHLPHHHHPPLRHRRRPLGGRSAASFLPVTRACGRSARATRRSVCSACTSAR